MNITQFATLAAVTATLAAVSYPAAAQEQEKKPADGSKPARACNEAGRGITT